MIVHIEKQRGNSDKREIEKITVTFQHVLGSVTVSCKVQTETGGQGVQSLTGGRSKRQRVTARHNQLNEVNDSNFNDCLCGSVVKPASDRALMCKQLGCETQWVLICFHSTVVSLSHYFNCLVPFEMYFT